MTRLLPVLLAVPLFFVPACNGGDAGEGEGDVGEGEGDVGEGEGDVGEGEGEGEGDIGEGEGEGEGEPNPDVTVDCDAPLAFDINRRSMNNVAAYHGISFDTDGNLVSMDQSTNNILRATRSGDASLFTADAGFVEQIETAPNGDILVVRSDSVARLSADGSVTRIGGDISGGYGITIGPDGNAYVSGASGVHRINLATNEMQLVLSPQLVRSPHDVDFSLDSRTMYVGTIQNQLWAVPVDDDLTPSGPPRVIAAGFNGWMDAVAVDECGYLWVPNYNASSLVRVNPQTETFTTSFCGSQPCYGHGATFGLDDFGWDHRALYLPRPYAGGEAVEVHVGVRDGKYARTFRGVPQDVPPPGRREIGIETCTDGVDNDNDFVVDCFDTDCDSDAACIENCATPDIDDDLDFAIGCGDTDCDAAPECLENCSNNIDDNNDFAVDCQDRNCQDSPDCVEICGNGLDDDNDNLVDCQEPSCFDPIACAEQCDNGVDDDGDFATDCQDFECQDSPLCVEICDNGFDDDSDGLVDCQETSCFDPAVCVEICDNGFDDDGDFAADCQDSACIVLPICEEICGNGIDDNDNFATDCEEDSCFDPLTCVEICGNGLDDDRDFVRDCEDVDCAAFPSCQEICGNGVDDNNNFATDCEEDSCFDPIACVESCSNGIDDDRDGTRDCSDPECTATAECLPVEVTIDLGDVDAPTAVTFPFLEGVANPTAAGNECVAIVADASVRVTAQTKSRACLERQNNADTELRLFDGANIVARNDDGPGIGFCSSLSIVVDAGSYALCARRLSGGGPLLPVQLEVIVDAP
jgi:SMP-30/Gluconolactonase/LRE-like region